MSPGPDDQAGGDDPYLWLEEVGGEAALAWVRERNAQTVARFATGERFTANRDGIREVLDSADKLPGLAFRGGHLYNFWRDEAHPRGLWRRTTVEGVDAGAWEVLLDLDALAEQEGENWVWAGATGLYPEYERYLVELSRGGADATVVREFDLAAPGGPAFVAGGFELSEAKTTIGWIDIDTVFVGTDFGPGTLTAPGYPRVAKRWRRGTPLAQAVTVFEGGPDDVVVYAGHDPTPGFEHDFVSRRFGFFDGYLYLLGPGDELTRIDVPSDAKVGTHREWLLVQLRTPWTVGGRTYEAGSLLAARLAEYLAGGRDLTLLFEPTPGVVLQYWEWTQELLVLGLLRNVHSELLVLDPGNAWAATPLAGVPAQGYSQVSATNPLHSDEILVLTTGFTEPSTLRYGSVRSTLRVLRQEPSFFDSQGLRVEQLWATSEDGARIPYFHVAAPADSTSSADPSGPTLLEAYGGFEISRTPAYDGGLGRAWLARGGGYVLANIRGGGEFGPEWHRAALREKRPRAFEDLAAVARDLVARGITTPERLGVTGGSNGGLLMGVMLTRYPSLFGAIVGWVPLLDMRRYHRMLAGHSWIAEYGDPDTDDWSFIGPYSPYQNVRSGQPYPPVLWITSTRDDRVHPGHARKMVARLLELGYPVSYYENIEGGHGAAADNEQRAFCRALAFEFLWRHLTAGA